MQSIDLRGGMDMTAGPWALGAGLAASQRSYSLGEQLQRAWIPVAEMEAGWARSVGPQNALRGSIFLDVDLRGTEVRVEGLSQTAPGAWMLGLRLWFERTGG